MNRYSLQTPEQVFARRQVGVVGIDGVDVEEERCVILACGVEPVEHRGGHVVGSGWFATFPRCHPSRALTRCWPQDSASAALLVPAISASSGGRGEETDGVVFVEVWRLLSLVHCFLAYLLIGPLRVRTGMIVLRK